MFHAFALSLAQLGDRAFFGVLAKSLAATIVIFASLGIGTWWGMQALLSGWAYGGAFASAATLVMSVLTLWLLFRAVAILVIGIFADDVVAAVEAKHYPHARTTARAVPLHRSLNMGLRSAARFVGVNLLLSPLYIVLLATGIGTAAVFFAANAWLLGRDLGDMVAARHMDAAAMRGWRGTNAARRFLLGLAGTGLFVVPLLNILAPLLGAAMATHMFHRTRP